MHGDAWQLLSSGPGRQPPGTPTASASEGLRPCAIRPGAAGPNSPVRAKRPEEPYGPGGLGPSALGPPSCRAVRCPGDHSERTATMGRLVTTDGNGAAA